MEAITYQDLKHLVSVPFIWMMVIPLVILDIFAEIYHHVCFSLYGIPLIERSKYIKVDRHKLEYLGPIDKINCAYCGYANGLLHYLTEIAAATEKYWCGIKHKPSADFIPPKHHADFIEYGDRRAFERRYASKPEHKVSARQPWSELLDKVLHGVRQALSIGN